MWRSDDAGEVHEVARRIGEAGIPFRVEASVHHQGTVLQPRGLLDSFVVVRASDGEAAADVVAQYEQDLIDADPHAGAEQPDLVEFGEMDDPFAPLEVEDAVELAPLPPFRRIALGVPAAGLLVALVWWAVEGGVDYSATPAWIAVGALAAAAVVWIFGGIPSAVRARRGRQ